MCLMQYEDPEFKELLAKARKARDELYSIVMRSKSKKLKEAYFNFFKALIECFEHIDKKYPKHTS